MGQRVAAFLFTFIFCFICGGPWSAVFAVMSVCVGRGGFDHACIPQTIYNFCCPALTAMFLSHATLGVSGSPRVGDLLRLTTLHSLFWGHCCHSLLGTFNSAILCSCLASFCTPSCSCHHYNHHNHQLIPTHLRTMTFQSVLKISTSHVKKESKLTSFLLLATRPSFPKQV